MSPTTPPLIDPAAAVHAVRASLSDDLLKPQYRAQPNRRPTTGHCYAASEAVYHLLGGKDAGWTPVRIRHEGGPHWFLRHTDGTVLDPTGDQFDTPVPYATGTGCGFLTRSPAARAREILRRVFANQPTPVTG